MIRIAGNPYDEIARIVKKWVDGPDGICGDFLVTVKLDDRQPQTELLLLDMDIDGWTWHNDFWEGENVFLCGFAPVSSILINCNEKGEPLP